MKVLFAGRKPVSAKCLAFLVTQPGIEVVGVLTDNHLAVSPTAEMAAYLNVPILTSDFSREIMTANILRGWRFGELLDLYLEFYRKFRDDLKNDVEKAEFECNGCHVFLNTVYVRYCTRLAW